MDPVSDLSFFVLLARVGNLSAAAQQLGVTPPTVSKRLAAMERRLGVRLLNRTTRRVSLSAEGEAYLAEGSRLLGDLQVLEQTIAGSQASPRGLLRVHGTLGFGRRHLAPALSAFARQHAEIEVQLTLDERPVDLVAQGLDLAVTLGELPDVRLTTRRLALNRRLLCASPRYLRSAGEPSRPGELTRHQCIVLRESDETFGAWQLRHGSRQETVKVRGRLATNDGDVALQWALDGHGILLRSAWDAAPYLRSGRLRPVLPEWRLPEANVSAVYPTKQNLSARTRACVDFLVDWFAQRPLPTWP
jgi:LysR family transcriptional regulator, transcriptional activator for dmlA